MLAHELRQAFTHARYLVGHLLVVHNEPRPDDRRHRPVDRHPARSKRNTAAAGQDASTSTSSTPTPTSTSPRNSSTHPRGNAAPWAQLNGDILTINANQPDRHLPHRRSHPQRPRSRTRLRSRMARLDHGRPHQPVTAWTALNAKANKDPGSAGNQQAGVPGTSGSGPAQPRRRYPEHQTSALTSRARRDCAA